MEYHLSVKPKFRPENKIKKCEFYDITVVVKAG